LIVWAGKIVQRRKILEPNEVNKYLLILGFFVLLAIPIKMLRGEIPNLNIFNQILGFKNWLNPILLFFILFNIINDEKTCNRMLTGLSLLFLALILNQFAIFLGITEHGAQVLDRFGRTGGFSAPGTYAITLVLFLPLILSKCLFYKGSKLVRFGNILLAFLFLMGLINAASRNGVVSLFAGMLVYFIILKRENILSFLPIIFLALTILVAGSTAFLIAPSSVKETYSEKFMPSTSEEMTLNKYSSGRVQGYTDLLEVVMQRPILGVGITAPWSEHNEYLRYLVRFGIIGFVIYLLIYLKIFRKILQALKTTKRAWEKHLYISYLAGFLGYLVGIFFTNAGPSMTIFWIYTAIIFKYAQLDIAQQRITSELNNPTH
jgi:O-antigen ligase